MTEVSLQKTQLGTTHRATYTREFGEWRATCRVCDFIVVGIDRRRTAATFRHHIRAMADRQAQTVVIDLSDHPTDTAADECEAENPEPNSA